MDGDKTKIPSEMFPPLICGKNHRVRQSEIEVGTKDALWSELPKSEHIHEKRKKDRSGLSEEGKRKNRNNEEKL